MSKAMFVYPIVLILLLMSLSGCSIIESDDLNKECALKNPLLKPPIVMQSAITK
ncbi:MAG: hypothetical protein LBJ19_00395 [Holosporaceae bacterium]|jgi:hypothetical protein|nr:hypothetical protein [Holosporaceae bacterium]